MLIVNVNEEIPIKTTHGQVKKPAKSDEISYSARLIYDAWGACLKIC